MTQRERTSTNAAATMWVLLMFLTACGSDAGNETASLEQNAVRAQAMTQLNALDSSLSALRALRRDDREVAITTLEAQLRSGMTVLYALLPSLKEDDHRIVQEVLQNAEKYVGEYNLKVVRPEN